MFESKNNRLHVLVQRETAFEAHKKELQFKAIRA